MKRHTIDDEGYEKDGSNPVDDRIAERNRRKVRIGELLYTLESAPEVNEFLIFERITPAPGNQDEVRMYEFDHKGSLVKDWGSHINVENAKVFARLRGFKFNEREGN